MLEAVRVSVARNVADMAIWQAGLRPQGYRCRSNTVICVNFGKLGLCACFFHHISKRVYTKRAIFIPNVGFYTSREPHETTRSSAMTTDLSGVKLDQPSISSSRQREWLLCAERFPFRAPWGFLTARPWAERGSCSAPGLFINFFFNRAAMGRARFLLCTWFIYFLTARPWAETATGDGAIEDFAMGTSDGTVRIVNSSCLVFVSACAADWSNDFVSIIISKSTKTAYSEETRWKTTWEHRR